MAGLLAVGLVWPACLLGRHFGGAQQGSAPAKHSAVQAVVDPGNADCKAKQGQWGNIAVVGPGVPAGASSRANSAGICEFSSLQHQLHTPTQRSPGACATCFRGICRS